MPTITRCIMHNYEFDINVRCKQCSLLLRYGVVCHWLSESDTSELLEEERTIKKLIKRRELMFLVKDIKGKLTLVPGDVNKEKFEETESLKKFNIKPSEVEEVYIIYDAFSPKIETKTVLRRLDIEGEELPVQKFISRSKEGASRKRRTRAEIDADEAAKRAAAVEPTEEG